MNENAKHWISTLKSRNFTQGYEKLGGPDCGYCPLGVACVLFERQTGQKLPKWRGEYKGKTFLDGGFEVVQEWLGMRDPCGFMGKTSHHYKHITVLNDIRRYNLAEIAEIIEKYQDQIFIDNH